MSYHYSRGSVNPWVLTAIAFIVLFVAAGAFAVWSYMNYTEQKTDVDAKIGLAQADARRQQLEEDTAKYLEESQRPYLEFAGPEDYGRLSFQYPKTWSVYVARDVARGGTYEAYLNPVTVPPIGNNVRMALRVTIETKSYESVVESYQSRVQKGDLRSGAVMINGENATRLDGSFTEDIRGSAVIFKIRDKTVTLRTDADTFGPKFNEIIASIQYNQ